MRYLGRLFTLLGIALTVALVHSWIVPLPAEAPAEVDPRVQLRMPAGATQDQALPVDRRDESGGTDEPGDGDEPVSSDGTDTVAAPDAGSEVQPDPGAVTPAVNQAVTQAMTQAEARRGTREAPCVQFDAGLGLPSTTDISLEQARFLWGLSEAIEADFPGTQVVFIDARALPGRYAEGHIAGAWHLTNEMMDRGELVWIDFQTLYEPPELGGDTIIVVYCDGGDCDESKNVRNRLFESGYTQTFIFNDGYPAWRDCGLPVVIGTDRFTSR